MSTADDLPTALDALSLNSPSAPLSLDSKLTLVCSDGGRVSVTAALLSSISSVFRDMLETGSGEMECQVSESKEAFELLLKTLRTGEAPTGETKWTKLYKHHDKYDIPSLKGALLCEGWRMHDKDPYFSYAVGSFLDDRALMRVAAEKSLDTPTWMSSSSLFRKLPVKESERLLVYQDAHDERRVKVLDEVQLGEACDCSDGRAYRNTVEGIWEIAAEQTKKRLQPSSNLVEVMSREVNNRSSRCKCDFCTTRLENALGDLERLSSREGGTYISLF